MAGFNKLSDQYKNQLTEYGYRLFDKEEQMESIKNHYPNISKLQNYFSYTYLRWLLFKQLVDTQEVQFPSISIDGDVFLIGDPEKIYQSVKGKNFLIQGCPCFTVVSDYQWFENYMKELQKLENDCLKYNKNIMPAIRNDKEYCNDSQYMVPLRHDQDLLQYLVSIGKLQQSKSEEVFNSQYYWIQNPIRIKNWVKEQQTNVNEIIIEKQNRFFIGKKEIPFIHFQSSFSWFCFVYLLLNKYQLTGLSAPFKDFTKYGTPTLSNRIGSKILRSIPGVKKMYSREFVCRNVFKVNEKTGNLFITDILNYCL